MCRPCVDHVDHLYHAECLQVGLIREDELQCRLRLRAYVSGTDANHFVDQQPQCPGMLAQGKGADLRATAKSHDA